MTYLAWSATGDAGAHIIYDMMLHLSSGNKPPQQYNASALVCLPKGQCDGDNRGAIRTARTTRPLGLKCCDAKTIAALVARPLSLALHEVVPQHQRGFLPTRRTYDNLLDIDTYAREPCLRHANIDDDDVDDPVAITLDTRAAFPSMCRAVPRHEQASPARSRP